MNFKKLAPILTDEELGQYYKARKSLSTTRPTDLNRRCETYILDVASKISGPMIDVGCGSGYLVDKIQKLSKFPVRGFDLAPPKGNAFDEGHLEKLPYANKSFELVLCTHTLEHIRNLRPAISELLRVCRHRLIIVLPRQKYFYYTLDEHLHFFSAEEDLRRLFPQSARIFDLAGDWLVDIEI